MTYNIHAAKFTNGTHLRNDDTISHSIDFAAFSLSTKICFVAEPTPEIKNGLAPIYSRSEGRHEKGIKNTKVYTKDGITRMKGEALPQGTVDCLLAYPTEVSIEGLGVFLPRNGETIVIHPGGTVTVEK